MSTAFCERRRFLPILGVLASLLPPILLAGSERYEFQQVQMGTLFRLVFFAPTDDHAQRAAMSAFQRIEELEQILSSYRKQSELTRVSRNAYQTPQTLSPDLYAVLDSSLRFSRLSRGAFDVTVAPLVNIWRQARRQGALPDRAALALAVRKVGYRNLLLNPRTRSLRFRVPDVELDLGGIAKGYAADEALRALILCGAGSALVDAGGDIRMGAPPPSQEGWIVALDAGLGTRRRLMLRDSAIATSGDAFQFVEIDGIRYSHIVDPGTGLGLRGSKTVHVIAPDGTMADALATTFSVLSPEEAVRMADQLDGVAVRLVCREGASEEISVSSRFPP